VNRSDKWFFSVLGIYLVVGFADVWLKFIDFNILQLLFIAALAIPIVINLLAQWIKIKPILNIFDKSEGKK